MSIQDGVDKMLAQLYRVEEALEADTDEFGHLRIEKVWPLIPPARQVVTSTPAITNGWSPNTVSYNSGLARINWSVNVNILFKAAQAAVAARMAEAFVIPVIEAFGRNIKLGLGEWTILNLRFNGFQPLYFQTYSDVAGQAIVGLDFFIDLAQNAGIEIAVGDPPL